MTRYKSKSSRRGRRAQKSGDDFERSIDVENKGLAMQGRAAVFKVPTPVRIHTMSKQGRLTGNIDLPVWSDFTGIIAGGRHVSFEAKSSSDADRFSFALIRDGQVDALTSAARLGGVAFVYVRRTKHDGDLQPVTYLFPVDDEGLIAGVMHKRSQLFLRMERSARFGLDGVTEPPKSRESIRWDAADAYRVRGFETWLDALERLEVI